MRVRTAKDTLHEGYRLPAGVVVTVEPEDLLGWVQYRVTWIDGPYPTMRELMEWVGMWLNPEDVEPVEEYAECSAFHAY